MLSLMDYLTLVMSVFAGSSVVLLTGLNLYFKVRRKYPITVNCWFCNVNTKVPYEFRNSWECPACDQYNGFTPDGDYNKAIPAQYAEDLNAPVSPRQESEKQKKNKVGLCGKCNSNQELKIFQLSSFSPINPLKYNEEIEAFRRKLEKEYKLCGLCEGVVARTLKKQHDWLLGLNFEELQKKTTSLKKSLKPKVKYGCRWTSKYGPGIIHHLLVLCAAWMSLAHSVRAHKENPSYVSYILSLLPYSVLPIIPLALKHELPLIGAALFAHVTASLLRRHRGPVKQGSIATLMLDAACFIIWLSLQILSWLSNPEAQELIDKQIGVGWITSLDFNKYMEITSFLVVASQVMVALVPRPVSTAEKKPKPKYTFTRMSVKKRPVSTYSDEFSDGEETLHEKKDPSPVSKSPKCMTNVQKEANTSQNHPESLKSPNLLITPNVIEEDVLGINNLSLGPANVGSPSRSGPKSPPKSVPRTKPVIQPARLNLKNIVQSSWVAGGYWQVPSSHQYAFAIPKQGFQVSPQNSVNSYFPYHTSPLSRSSSQSSGFVSNSGTASSVPMYNSNSLQGSASSSICGDQENCSVFSEPAYHRFPPASYFGNIFSGGHMPSYSSSQGGMSPLYGMLTSPYPMIPHYPSFYRQGTLPNSNHCCCCQNSANKAHHPASVKVAAEDSDCLSSSSSGYSDSPPGRNSSKVSQFPTYKVSSAKNKESKNVVHQPGSAILAVMQENVFLMLVLGGSLMFNAVMLYLMVVGKGTGLFAS
ncbi:uncharacterized protein LOC124159488 [Ischnura elegans]|uniref:uncharacterized protein LOC124159488 n=1 Tax=Ischnura elegans TaxID=197161 RepID=UPI001ED87ACB|nr:uncharacterized protein LOC124159488 [Ischnura elegans]